MKNIKLFVYSCIALIISNIQIISQTKPDISKYNCFTANIKYSADGLDTEGLLLFVNHGDPEIPVLQYSNVYLLNQSGQNILLLSDSNAFISVYDIKVSKDSKYIAIYCVGEGHPWIEIYDLQKLIELKNQVLVADINPYPGNVNLVGWQNNLLIVESDINLLLKNDGKDLSDSDLLKKSRKFAFDIAIKKFKEFK